MNGHAHPDSSFASPEHISIGAVVFDRDDDMVGMVSNIVGTVISLERPTGRQWHTFYRRLRPATERENRQLRALAKLQRARTQGMKNRTDGSG
ncbi:hypothetical protein ACWCO0_11725 [Streptomyces tubercidicus]